mgnify:CR=1 FL=1
MNVTYEYYMNSFGGSLIPEDHWKRLEVKMSARLNRYTFDRMKEDAWPIKAKTALCEMCEYAYEYQKHEGITSENNDGYSVSYDTSKSEDSALYRIAMIYLANTGLMDLVVDINDYECNNNDL